MKITFIVPPAFDGKKPAERSAGCTRIVYPMPNIYELTVAAILEQENHTVSYLDFVMKESNKSEFEQTIAEYSTDIFCIWSVNLAIETDKIAATIIRKYHSKTPILFMGPGPTYFYKEYLFDTKIIVIRGEPELITRELVQAISDNKSFNAINGLSYLSEDGKIITNPSAGIIENLDSLPIPSRHLLEGHIYRNPKIKVSPYTSVVTSRNCPFQCIYCVPSSLTFAREINWKENHNSKPPITYRSIENIESELSQLSLQGYKSIAFLDDNFIWDTERLRQIVAILKKYNFHWGCQARADAITEERALIMHESCCEYIDLGVESFNNEILKFIRKGLTEEKINTAVNLLNKYKIPVKINILIGTSPLETKETIKDTIRKAKMLKVSQVMFNIVSPFPGTKFYQIATENGWIKEGKYRPTDVQRESILEYPHLSSKEMAHILFWSNVSFYLRPKLIFQHLIKFRSFTDFFMAVKAFKTKLFG